MLYFRTREEQSKMVAEKSQGKKDGGWGGEKETQIQQTPNKKGILNWILWPLAPNVHSGQEKEKSSHYVWHHAAVF